MKFRKQARTPPPGQQFLRALADGRDEPAPPDPAPAGGSGLERRLLETERRAATAEAALEQIRSEAEERLADARGAIAREREARLAAERELGEVPPAAMPATEAEAGQEPAVEAEPPAALEQAAEPEPEPEEAPPPARLRAEAGSAEAESAEEGDEEAWPTPWLGPKRKSGGRRRLFGRS